MHLETVVGTAPETLVELSRGAALLVVGADAPDAEIKVADYCEQHCEWDVLVVSEPLQPAFGTRSAVELVKDDLVEERRDRVQSSAQGQDRLNAVSLTG